MTDADIGDLYVYPMAQPPVRSENRRHALDFPYNLRFALGLWQWLYLEPGAFEPDPAKDAAWNRGAPLVRHVTHCGDCHSPPARLAAVHPARDLPGSQAGTEDRTSVVSGKRVLVRVAHGTGRIHQNKTTTHYTH